MTLRPDARDLLLTAGFLTWVTLAGGWVWWAVGHPFGAARVCAAGLWLAFPALFWAAAVSRAKTRRRVAALAGQSVVAVALAALGAAGHAGALLAVVAGQLPLLLSMRHATRWVALQSAAFVVALLARARPGVAVYNCATFAGLQLFALGAAWLAEREATARADLARVHAELVGTQSLLSDSTRAAERLRVSRELHDTLGHHLTALALQLEVAKNTAPGNDAVLRAQEIARAMLGEVREVVGALRTDRPVDLRRALGALVAADAAPRVHLAFADDVAVTDAATAHALFRCAQEAFTNAARHADAANLWITVSTHDGRVTVRVRDDGRGAPAIVPGHGLRGLHERLREIGGTMDVASSAGGGVQVTAVVPARSVA